MKKKICGIYKITNKVTEEIYIGSSNDVKRRWRVHKAPSEHKRLLNNKMYQDMDELGIDSFEFEVLEEVPQDELRIKEDEYIKKLNPEYNDRSAFRSEEDKKAYRNAYNQSEKGKATRKSYQQSKKGKAYQKSYKQTEKCKTYQKNYDSQLCNYNGEVLTLCALRSRFQRWGIPQPTEEAKKFLIAS